MADKFWYTSWHTHFEAWQAPLSYTSIANNAQGGWRGDPSDPYYPDYNINFVNGECTYDANGILVSNATASKSVVQIGGMLPLALNCYTDTRYVGRGCLEFFVDYSARSSTGILMSSTYSQLDSNDLGQQVGWPDNAIIGFQVRVKANNELQLVMGNWEGDAEPVDYYDTGLIISSGVKHFFIQFDGQTLPARTTIGLAGNTFTVLDVPQGMGNIISLGSSRVTWFVTQAVGVTATFNDWRITANVLRYGSFIQGAGTYTPPSIGYPDFSPPSNPLTITHNAYGIQGVPNGAKLRMEVLQVTGGTPPYTYQWVERQYGLLDWLEPDDPSYAQQKSIVIDTRKLSENDAYVFACLVTDADGTIGTTLETDNQWTYLDGATFQTNILDTVVYATVGSQILLNPTMIDNGRLLGYGPTRHNPYQLNQWPLHPYNPDKIPIAFINGSGSYEPVTAYNGEAGVIDPYEGGYSITTPLGSEWADSVFIADVQPEHDGLEVVYDYFYQSTVATLTLRVVNEERSVGWWKTLIETVQTAPLDYTESKRYKSWLEGVQAVVDFIASPEYSISAYYTQYDNNYAYLIQDMPYFAPAALTEYDMGVYSEWRTNEYAANPATDYPIAAEFSWDVSGPFQAGRSLGVNVAFWHVNYYYPDCGPWKLTNNGSEFTKVFQCVYEATWDGLMDGKQDAVQVNPQYTSLNPRAKYVGTPYEQEYIDRYTWGYDCGYAM